MRDTNLCKYVPLLNMILPLYNEQAAGASIAEVQASMVDAFPCMLFFATLDRIVDRCPMLIIVFAYVKGRTVTVENMKI